MSLIAFHSYVALTFTNTSSRTNLMFVIPLRPRPARGILRDLGVARPRSGNRLKTQFICIGLCNPKDMIDQRQEPPATFQNLSDIGFLFLRQFFLQCEQRGKPQDVVHRGTQLVTGARKKFALCLQCLFQFGSSLFHSTLKVGVGEAQALMQIKDAHCPTDAREEPVSFEWFAEEIANA